MDAVKLISDFEKLAKSTPDLNFRHIDKKLGMVHLWWEAVPFWDKRVLVTAGMHGDEIACPLAVYQLLEKEIPFLTKMHRIRVDFVPIINFNGLRLEKRNSREDIDMNRDFIHPNTVEIQKYKNYFFTKMSSTLYDAAVTLHEDYDGTGFYTHYSYRNRKSWAEHLVKKMGVKHLLDRRYNIDGFRPNSSVIYHGISSKDILDGEQAWLLKSFSNCVFTPETNMMLPLNTRINQHVEFLKMVVEQTEP
jgi:predicted deacylase